MDEAGKYLIGIGAVALLFALIFFLVYRYGRRVQADEQKDQVVETLTAKGQAANETASASSMSKLEFLRRPAK